MVKENSLITLMISITSMFLIGVFCIKKTARMIADYNHSRLHIMTDKMCGSISTTLALTRSESNELYPSSTLREDIRRFVTEYHMGMAVCQKSIHDSEYRIPAIHQNYLDL